MAAPKAPKTELSSDFSSIGLMLCTFYSPGMTVYLTFIEKLDPAGLLMDFLPLVYIESTNSYIVGCLLNLGVDCSLGIANGSSNGSSNDGAKFISFKDFFLEACGPGEGGESALFRAVFKFEGSLT